MSKEKEIIRLHHQELSQRSIFKMLKTSDRKIRQVLNKLDELNMSYDQIKEMNDADILDLFSKPRKEVNITEL